MGDNSGTNWPKPAKTQISRPACSPWAGTRMSIIQRYHLHVGSLPLELGRQPSADDHLEKPRIQDEGRNSMAITLQRRNMILGLGAFVTFATLRIAFAGDDDLVHLVEGTVKHVDKGAKAVVVKADDGTEHTIKWTDKTTLEGMKDAGKDIKEG